MASADDVIYRLDNFNEIKKFSRTWKVICSHDPICVFSNKLTDMMLSDYRLPDRIIDYLNEYYPNVYFYYDFDWCSSESYNRCLKIRWSDRQLRLVHEEIKEIFEVLENYKKDTMPSVDPSCQNCFRRISWSDIEDFIYMSEHDWESEVKIIASYDWEDCEGEWLEPYGTVHNYQKWWGNLISHILKPMFPHIEFAYELLVNEHYKHYGMDIQGGNSSVCMSCFIDHSKVAFE